MMDKGTFSLWFVMAIACCITLLQSCSAEHKKCIPVDFGHGTTVCKCNDTYCDTIEENVRLPVGKFAQYRTSHFGERLERTVLEFNNKTRFDSKVKSDGLFLTVDKSKIYQTILGFGAAFTDSATMNIMSRKPTTQELLLKSLFTSEGLEYTVMRIPIAASDYSTRVYSYDEVDGDFDLQHFSLQKEDLDYKCPVIDRALKMNKRKMYLFGSPWSAPGWMKNTGEMAGGGELKGEAGNNYHKTYAQYFVKFIEEYAKHGVPIWGITVQNEPHGGLYNGGGMPKTGFNATMERDFIVRDLGPALEASGHSDVKLMLYDDQRPNISTWVNIGLSEGADKYVSGIAVHWYKDKLASPEILTETHFQHPDKFILGTEACNGPAPQLGKWEYTEVMVNDIIDDLSNWLVGWVYWNAVLDMEGGPSWTENHQGAPVIVDYDPAVFYKDTMYYGLGHFSKFLPKGSQHIGMIANHNQTDTVKYIAFRVPEDNSTVVILSNTDENDLPLHLNNVGVGYSITIVPAHSVTTFVWWD